MDTQSKRLSLARQAIAAIPVPAVLRPDVKECTLLFTFGAVSTDTGGVVHVDHSRLVALIDVLAYFNASRKDIEVRIASNSRTFQRLAEDLQSNNWTQIWPYYRALVPLVTPRAYFAAIDALLQDEESDLVLLRPIVLRIVHDTARALLDKEMPGGLRYMHTGIKLASGPRGLEIAALLGLSEL